MFLWSPSYMVYMLPAFLLVMLAQLWVKSTYRKWSQVRNSNNITGAEAARRLLDYGNLLQVTLEGARGRLSDHYDPRSQTPRLSPAVAQEQSVASLAIAAHEIGHALQDRDDYFPLRFRAAIVPAANIGSNLGWILILIGLFIRSAFGTQLAWIGVMAFAIGAVFSLATLPVELNASARAQALLTQSGLIQTIEDRRGVKAVLNAAAFTYVAALAAALLQLLYYISLVGGISGRRRR
ncbi:MAG: zinc metallopeptidase [Anaerolineales bacterium]|nr:MAG: zinc metallopeptidase [Anaerolineales bacterium]